MPYGRENYASLGRALALSLALHTAFLLVADLAIERAAENAKHSASRRTPAALLATLQRPQAPPRPETPPLTLPASHPSAAADKTGKPDLPPRTLHRPVAVEVVVRRALAQLAGHLLYPEAAIAQGLEGEVLVMLFFDDAGNVIAARVEKGSGHAVLDQAAVAAARTLRSLPLAATREVLLPVRFRLN